MQGTLKLLNSSTILGISGSFRLYVAYLLLKIEPIPLLCLAAGIIVYSVYTLDRTVKAEEDLINRSEEVKANRNLIAILVFLLLLIGMLILILLDFSPFGAVFPFFMGFMYSKGIKIKGFSIKLKGGLGIKNIVVAFTWAVFLCLLICWKEWVYLPLILCFFFVKSFINTVICDCRDVKGDSHAGLKTFPVYWGVMKTRRVLQAIHSFFHILILAIVLLRLMEFDAIILIYSWLIGITYIHFYATSKKTVFRSIMVHGEWVHMVIFREFAQLVLSPSRSV